MVQSTLCAVFCNSVTVMCISRIATPKELTAKIATRGLKQNLTFSLWVLCAYA